MSRAHFLHAILNAEMQGYTVAPNRDKITRVIFSFKNNSDAYVWDIKFGKELAFSILRYLVPEKAQIETTPPKAPKDARYSVPP